MELKIGDYCYIKNCRKYGIGEIVSFKKNNNVVVKFKNYINTFSVGNVISNSEAINLIKIGDYVNDYKVIHIDFMPTNVRATVDFVYEMPKE